jgi:hypothetical protein
LIEYSNRIGDFEWLCRLYAPRSHDRQASGPDRWPTKVGDEGGHEGGVMATSRFLLGGVASALLLTGGVFLWKGYSQIAAEDVVPAPPPRLAALPVAGPDAPKRGAAPPALPAAKAESREEGRRRQVGGPDPRRIRDDRAEAGGKTEMPLLTGRQLRGAKARGHIPT